MNRSSRNRLTLHTLSEFTGDTLHDALGRAVSRAECLARKEFFEAWAVAKRVRRRLRARRVVELAAGHGLLSFMLLLLDRDIQEAVCIDRKPSIAFEKLQAELAKAWPRLGAQVRFERGDLTKDGQVDGDAIVASVHACGRLTDRVLDRAIAGRAQVAVVPCCHCMRTDDTGSLAGWMADDLAIDATRALRLRAAGYRVFTQTIPDDITPKNRILLGIPDAPTPAPS